VIVYPFITKIKAKKHIYESSKGGGVPYDHTRCAYELFSSNKQCKNRNGYGPGKLYCYCHSKLAIKYGRK